MANSENSQPKIEPPTAKLKLVTAMQAGTSWQNAAQLAGLITSRTTAYRLLKGFREHGQTALLDRRQGHPSKLKPDLQNWLVESCQAQPQLTSRQLQAQILAQFGLEVSVSRLNEVRANLGVSRQNLPDPTAQANSQTPKIKKK